MAIQIYTSKKLKDRIVEISKEYDISLSNYGKMLLKIGVLLHDYGVNIQLVKNNIDEIVKTILKGEARK